MAELDEAWKAKTLNDSQSIQSIKVNTLILNNDDDRRLFNSNVSNSNQQQQGPERVFQSMIGGDSSNNSNNGALFASRNENKLITNITLNTEQKKKYEELSKKFIDLKQKLVNFKESLKFKRQRTRWKTRGINVFSSWWREKRSSMSHVNLLFLALISISFFCYELQNMKTKNKAKWRSSSRR